MNNASYQSHTNDQKGYLWQLDVAKHLEKITGQIATVCDTHGVDVICGDYRVEVKGTGSFYQKSKINGKTRHAVRGWKGQVSTVPENLTHFAFVLDEEHVNTRAIIYLVGFEDVKKVFDKHPHSQWVYFRVHWVWEHYIYNISRIP